MFGYVKIYKDELKCRDYELFRAYYCGLCRTIGKKCSQASRLGLSYDLVFLAVVLTALRKDKPEFSEKPCIAHPLRKRKSVNINSDLEYAAHAGVILGYLKLCDDFDDDKSIKAFFGKLMYYPAFRKSKKIYGCEYEKLKEQMIRLKKLEKENSPSIDAAADCFAKMLEALFTPEYIKEQRRELAWLGYNVGRWIYIIDAYADMNDDFKSGAYNPFLCGIENENKLEEKRKNIKATLDYTLTFTLENAASAYELLKIYKNDEIIRNVLYLGMRAQQEHILNVGKEKEDESL